MRKLKRIVKYSKIRVWLDKLIISFVIIVHIKEKKRGREPAYSLSQSTITPNAELTLRAIISPKFIALLNRYKSLGTLIVFHCYSVLLPMSTNEASSVKDFSGNTSSSYTATSEDSA